MSTFDELLHALFDCDAEQLRERLKPLTEQQRKELFRDFTPILISLVPLWESEAISLDTNAPAERSVSGFEWYTLFTELGTLREHFLSNRNGLNLDERQRFDVRMKSEDFWNTDHPKRLDSISRNIHVMYVGLSDRQSIDWGFAMNHRTYVKRSTSPIPAMQTVCETFLDRPEAWKKDVLIRMCKKMADWVWVWTPYGFPNFLTDAKRRFPEWTEELRPFYGLAMMLDGFTYPDWDSVIDPDIVWAGFEADNRQRAWSIPPTPIVDRPFSRRLLEMVNRGDLPREFVVRRTVERLTTPLSDHLHRGWVNFYLDLNLTEAEKAEHCTDIVGWIGANTSAVAKLGIDEATNLISLSLVTVNVVFPMLGVAINHKAQAVAQAAFKLIRKLADGGKIPFADVVTIAVDALSSPHKKLREDIFKWLVKRKTDLTPNDIVRLSELGDFLGSADRAMLLEVLPDKPSTPVVEEPKSNLADLLARTGATPSAESQPMKAWRDYLTAVANGTPGELAPRPPDFSSSLDIDFPAFQSAEELAVALVEIRPDAVPPLLQLERILDGIVRFQGEGTSKAVRDTLRTLADLQTNEGAIIVNPRIRPLLQCWMSGGECAPFEALVRDLPFYIDNTQTTSDVGWARRITNAASRIRAGVPGSPLAIPTNQVGWLRPDVFANRYLSVNLDQIEITDLTAALNRLSPDADYRVHAWEQLRGRVQVQLAETESDTTGLPYAVALALGPEASARGAAAWFVETFKTRDPRDILFGGDELEILTKEPFIRSWNAPENLFFHLFCAALRARVGWGDATDWVGGLKIGGFKYYQSGWRSFQNGKPEFVTSLVEDDAYTQGITRTLFGHFTVSENTIPKIDTFDSFSGFFYPFAYTPYLPLRAFQAGCEYDFDPVMIDGTVYTLPISAQPFFEAAGIRIRDPQEQHNDYVPSRPSNLLNAGKHRYVNVRPQLAETTIALVQEEEVGRETIVALIIAWLDDGRVTPKDFAEALATVIHSTRKGFLFLDRALTSFTIAHPAGKHLVLFALETALARGVDGLPPKHLSIVLDRLETLLDEIGRSVHDAAALAVLTALAAQKKKSVARERAQRLLARARHPNQIDLPTAIVVNLLEHALTRPDRTTERETSSGKFR